MQDWSLTVDKILEHARTWHGHREIVSRSTEGPIVRTTYAQVYARAKQLSSALNDMAVRQGDRIATLAWNNANHLEVWYGIMGIGAICHTLNPRLFAEQLIYIINHAEDRAIFTDATFLPLLEEILPSCPTVELIVVLTDEANMVPFRPKGVPGMKFQAAVSYERLIAGRPTTTPWGGFDERLAAGLCYTSGTTGNPKGVLYSHRSNFLHTYQGLSGEEFGLTVNDVVMPIVPMFHANAWGLAYDAPAVGAKLVLPGPKADGASIHELMEAEGVTFAAAVPTVWQMLLTHLDQTGGKLTTLKRIVVGGSALPEGILRAFGDRYGVRVDALWGMTETSPIGTVATVTPEVASLPFEEQIPYRLKAGRAPLGLDMKITDDAGNRLPHDGKTFGRLKVKGGIVSGSYFKGEGGDILDEEGFFDTGDVATIDPYGYMAITDRAKDVVKSGGEWISSIEIENIAMSYPKTAVAAVIGVPHPKWDERPILLVKLKDGETATKEEYCELLDGKIAKWWMPDDVVFTNDIPLGATGKIDKKVIRAQCKDYVLPSLAVAAAGGALALAASKPETLYAPTPPAEPEPVAELATDDTEAVPVAPEAGHPETAEAAAGEAVAEAGDEIAGEIAAAAPEPANPLPEAVLQAPATAEPESEAGQAPAVGDAPPSDPAALAEVAQVEAADTAADDSGTQAEALVADPPVETGPGDEAEPAPFPIAEPVTFEDATPAEQVVADTPSEPQPEPEPDSRRDLPGQALPLAGGALAAPLAMSGERKAPKAGGKTDTDVVARRILNAFTAIAIAPLAVVIAGIVLVRTGMIDWTVGYQQFLVGDGTSLSLSWKLAWLSAATGIVGLFISLFAGEGRLTRKALINIGITVVTFAVLYAVYYRAQATPPIHEVATDWTDPLTFSDAVMVARGAGANPVDLDPALPLNSGAYAGRRLAEINAEACPDARPVIRRETPDKAFEAAKAAVVRAGMTIATDDVTGGRLEAIARTPVYGFVDDVVVRVRQHVEGARIDIRSVSRERPADFGANCSRVVKLVRTLSA